MSAPSRTSPAGSVSLTSAPAPNAAARPRSSDGPTAAPVRVLVVDDEPTLTELLSMALRYEGWEVRTAGDGLAAVRAARDFRPDAVVLDMMLPDFDGLEVLRRMRGDDPDVPVLFLTAKDAVEDRDRRAHRRRRRLRHQAVQPRGGRRPAARA